MHVHKLTPNFEVNDIRKTVAFYESVLGFSLVMAIPESQDGIEQAFADDKPYVYALMRKDEVEIMFQRTDSFKEDVVLAKDLPIGASVSFYMEMEGIDDLYAHVLNAGITPTELHTTWYGMREFYMSDTNGYILGFAEKASEGN